MAKCARVYLGLAYAVENENWPHLKLHNAFDWIKILSDVIVSILVPRPMWQAHSCHTCTILLVQYTQS